MSANLFSKLTIYVIISIGLVMNSVAQERKPNKLPSSYRHIGTYKMISKIKVEKGEAMSVVITPLVYRVYSDGIEVRVYCRAAGEDSYTAYQIYRSDGIGAARASGQIDFIAGVQAMSNKAEMMRQISVTRESITMVKMPPRSHRVIIIRADSQLKVK